MKVKFNLIKKKKTVHEDTRLSSIITNDTGFVATESYSSLRTNIIFSLADRKANKVILFTSAIPGEGKTTVCLNTAITFAKTNSKVLVIDADLRKPRTHRYLGLHNKAGLSDVIGGFASLQDVILHVKEHNIDLLPAGQIPPNPAELLFSDEMRNLIATLKETYDYIFIDTPPITIVTDAQMLISLSSGVMLVVREDFTPKKALTDAISSLRLSNAKILGCVLNDAQRSGDLYKKSYRRGSYRRYYYYSYNSYAKKRSGDAE